MSLDHNCLKCGDCGHVQHKGDNNDMCYECNGPMIEPETTEYFMVGCTDCGGRYPWTDLQLMYEGHRPQVGDFVNICDNGGCDGTVYVKAEAGGALVIENESPWPVWHWGYTEGGIMVKIPGTDDSIPHIPVNVEMKAIVDDGALVIAGEIPF